MNDALATAASLAAIARQAPRVHCITNTVALNYTANMLLAVGAVPTMTLAASEITDFVTCARSVSINIGTLDEQRRQAIDTAIEAATHQGKPWILDPVLADSSAERCRYAWTLLRRKPTVIRGNQNEITALGATDTAAAVKLARAAGVVVAQTGATDIVTDGYRQFHVDNGHPLMTRVTAMGCAESALVAAFLAIEPDALAAAARALLALGVAGELAAATSPGPGSLQFQILDWLYRLDAATLAQHSRISELPLT